MVNACLSCLINFILTTMSGLFKTVLDFNLDKAKSKGISDDEIISINDSDDDNSNSNISDNSSVQQSAASSRSDQGCKNPWHEKWGEHDADLKWPSHAGDMAQLVFQMLGYERAMGVRTRFCQTCINKANTLDTEEYREVENYARLKLPRQQSDNANIQAQLERLDKLDVSDDEKVKQARQLRMLTFVNPGRFMDDFDPERSSREMKKMNRRLYKEKKNVKKNQSYDEYGVLLSNKKDLCDCMEEECPGCHFPCPKCSSEKCGGECRCNRKWVYEFVESEGRGTKFSWSSS